MPRTIDVKTRVSAVKDYVTSNDTLRDVAARHGMSSETLRRFVGDKARKRGSVKKLKAVASGVLTIPFKTKDRKERSANKSVPNANRRWSKGDDELLRDAVYSKFTVKETVDLLGRSAGSIYCRKSQLMEDGFIKATRFTLPTGIKRNRRKVEEAQVEFENKSELDRWIEDNRPVHTKEVAPAPVKDGVNLRELASLVKEYGVSITMNVTSEGMEVKMHN